MSRSRRKSKHTNFSREETSYRRASTRKHRARCRSALQRGRYDDMPHFRRTQGWLTW